MSQKIRVSHLIPDDFVDDASNIEMLYVAKTNLGFHQTTQVSYIICSDRHRCNLSSIQLLAITASTWLKAFVDATLSSSACLYIWNIFIPFQGSRAGTLLSYFICIIFVKWSVAYLLHVCAVWCLAFSLKSMTVILSKWFLLHERY